MKRDEIQIRDPFILTIPEKKEYYLFGTTDKNCWGDRGYGFESYKSYDLENWEGPFEAFVPPEDFWADRHFWAPEVYSYGGRFYMFASFKSPDKCRGTQVLVSDNPEGPFAPYSDGPVTPPGWECLDGTFYIDKDKKPWMIFCREWLQVTDGQMWAMPLSDNLKSAAGEPVFLFSASKAAWVCGSIHNMDGVEKTVYVTDGPYIYRTKTGKLLMIWSSGGQSGYAVGIAESESGEVTGPWVHRDTPLFEKNGGHGMIFTSFDGHVIATLHSPNKTPNERPCFFDIEDTGDTIRLK